MATTFADQLRSLSDEALGALIQLRPDLVVPVPVRRLRAGRPRPVPRLGRPLPRRAWTSSPCRPGRGPAQPRRGDRADLGRRDPRAGRAGRPRRRPGGDRPAAGPVPAARPRGRAAGGRRGRRGHLAVPGRAGPARRLPGRRRPPPSAPTRPSCAARCWPRRRPPARCWTGSPPGPPVGALAAGGTVAEPVRWLVDSHVLVPVSEAGRAPRADGELVELPREVGHAAAPRHRPAGCAAAAPAAPAGAGRATRRRSTRPAPGRSMEAVRTTETLLEALAAEPAPVLQDRRPRRTRPQAAGPGRRAWTRPRRRAAAGDRVRGRPARRGRRGRHRPRAVTTSRAARRGRRDLPAHRRVRPVAGAQHRPALGGAGPRRGWR